MPEGREEAARQRVRRDVGAQHSKERFDITSRRYHAARDTRLQCLSHFGKPQRNSAQSRYNLLVVIRRGVWQIANLAKSTSDLVKCNSTRQSSFASGERLA